MSYDLYERVAIREYKSNGSGDAFWNQNGYTYKNTTSGTTGLIETHTSTVNGGTPITYTYSYDLNGNITRITYSTGEVIRYVYDDLGQLIREDNGLRNTTYCYTYDDAGNIIAKTTHPLTAQGVTPTSTQNTDSYTYSSSAWGDLLTSFDGREITYDEIGNPLTYNNGVGYTFTWTGRQMTGLKKGNVTYSFTYNDEGIRTTKTKAGVTTTYYLSGSQIIGEETNGNITLYVYDSDGAPLGMQHHAASYAEDVWDVYWFEKNLLGDVVALYDEAGTKLITYTYDAHGRCLRNQYNGGYSTTAMNNPFRYRGYYYDSDLELYVLNSRYYDPYTGRFISPDSVEYLGANGDLNSYNLYAYCSNNPVMYTDPSGHLAITLTTLLICGLIVSGALVGGAVAGVNSYNDGDTGWELAKNILEGTIIGGAVGGVIGYFAAPSIVALLSSTGTLGGTFAFAGGFLFSGSGIAITSLGELALTGVVTSVGVLSGTIVMAAQWEPGSWPGDDPTISPGDGFEWSGKNPIGGEKGAWVNRLTGDSLHPDLNHPTPIGPHWDWINKIKNIAKRIFK